MRARVLIAEDEASLAGMIAEALKRQGYDCETVHDGDSALDAAEELRPDIALLDVMLPKLDGFEVTRRLRDGAATKDMPILLLTARVAEEDVLAGFAAGADDYVKKPFSIAELSARVKALLQRRGRADGGAAPIEVGGLRVDAVFEEVFLDGERLDLSATEYRLLGALASAGGRVVSRDELLRRVWGMSVGDSRTLDAHIFRLRRKLERDPENPERLQTVRGRGFRLAAPGDPAR